MVKQILSFLLLLFISVSVSASHLLGGSITYKHLSSTSLTSTYSITLELFRDCSDGVNTTVQFESSIDIGVYFNNVTKNKKETKTLKLTSKTLKSVVNCYSNSNMCVEAGFYEGIITLDSNSKGYILSNVTCCRPSLNNVKDDNGTPVNGFTFYTIIPPTNFKNTAPTYKFGPSMLCSVNITNSDYWGATDSDGDSLVYDIVAPYKGGKNTIEAPPPYFTNPLSIDYNQGYSFDKPFGNLGNVTIDRATGQFTSTNSVTGKFAFCIETKEYRKGKLIGIYRRDYPLIFINTPPESEVFTIKLLKPSVASIQYISASLSWQICPNNFPLYSVEHKEKNTAWEVIGETKNRDKYIDTITNNVMHYYRIKATINGKLIVSNIDSILILKSGINEKFESKNSVYPNPTKDYLYFKNPSVLAYAIYDIAGKLLLESNEIISTSETKIDVRNLKLGIYFVVIKTEKGLVTHRFIKN
jgi:hypothetical protein